MNSRSDAPTNRSLAQSNRISQVSRLRTFAACSESPAVLLQLAKQVRRSGGQRVQAAVGTRDAEKQAQAVARCLLMARLTFTWKGDYKGGITPASNLHNIHKRIREAFA